MSVILVSLTHSLAANVLSIKPNGEERREKPDKSDRRLSVTFWGPPSYGGVPTDVSPALCNEPQDDRREQRINEGSQGKRSTSGGHV